MALTTAQKINMPGYYWYHGLLAASYAQLDRMDESRDAIARVLELYPDFAKDAYVDTRKFIKDEEHTQHIIQGLRKAGLDIPDEPVASQ